MNNKTNLTDEEIRDLWKNEAFPGSFSSARTFQQALLLDKQINLPLMRVYKALSTLPEYLVLLRPIRHFPKRSYKGVHGFFNLVQADIALMPKSGKYSYILVVIDVFSRHLYAKLMKTKTAKETVRCFEAIFSKVKLYPSELQTDEGGEFRSPYTKAYFQRNDIYWSPRINPHKAVFAENAIYYLKKKLYTQMFSQNTKIWHRMLQKTVDKINGTPVQALNNLRPREINSPLDDPKVDAAKKFVPPHWKSKRGKTSFEIGDVVILDKKAAAFQKSYLPRVSSILEISRNVRKRDKKVSFLPKKRAFSLNSNSFFDTDKLRKFSRI